MESSELPGGSTADLCSGLLVSRLDFVAQKYIFVEWKYNLFYLTYQWNTKQDKLVFGWEGMKQKDFLWQRALISAPSKESMA